ncbi:hypothetical protein [Microbulbifer sp. 2304DJ12-6]|uniref:hypothetical protein n=1 Tax=Microbulbifer sp. 2304DJ12-6 TaxID=3233340 RepID=UPI0039AF095F
MGIRCVVCCYRQLRNLVGVLLLVATSLKVSAQHRSCNDFGHFDLFIDIVPPAAVGAKILVDSAGSFPLSADTGNIVVPADFGDLPGGPHKTDDPGWVVNTGGLLDGEKLWFRALGALRYWDPTIEAWIGPVNGERVRYFGTIPFEVFLRNDPVELAFYKQGTIWSYGGLEGPLESPIDQAAPDGSMHTHLDFCVEAADGDCALRGVGHTGNPSTGAYLIELQLFSDAGAGEKYRSSRPIQVLLNNGLTGDQCGTAINALIQPTNVDSSEALPGAGVLIMTGY